MMQKPFVCNFFAANHSFPLFEAPGRFEWPVDGVNPPPVPRC